MLNKILSLYQLDLKKIYLITTDYEIYEDEYDYIENLHTEDYTGPKDSVENWENQMLEENCEWLTGLEILTRVLRKGR